MLKTKQPSPPAPDLAARIEAIHKDISEQIAAKAAELRKIYEGVFSQEYIEFDLKKKFWDCPCKQYQALKDEG
jgi:hypothetical protein